jgi:quinol-cytochrome oxidoreductase complex cytochrome b subunit
MIATLMVHVLTAFIMKGFARPRELTWVSGVVLLGITFTLGFTGYLLPWHQVAVNATKIGLQSIQEVGNYLPGAMADWPRVLKETIQGEASVGQATLSRFFALHVIILPLAILLFLGWHLLSVQLHGMSPGIDGEPKRREKFFPTFFIKDLTAWGVAFMALFVVALCIPFESFYAYPLFEPFDPNGSTPDGIKPEWYFYFVYYPLELLPFSVILLGVAAVSVLLFITPWVFKNTHYRALRLVGALAAAYLLIMTVLGAQIYLIFKG